MGLKSTLMGKRVYFDTNIFIYWLEGNSSLTTALQALRESIMESACSIHSCDLVYTEILPALVKNADHTAIKNTLDFLAEDIFEINPVQKHIFLKAGFLRGEIGMKAPDSIHVASAIDAQCDIFLTNDKGIRVPKTMQRVIISDY